MTESIVIDRVALESDWRKREIDTIREKLVASKLLPDKLLEFLGADLQTEKRWMDAFETRGGATLLAYFVFVWGMYMWELTGDHEEVRENMAAARTGYLRAYHTTKKLLNANDSADATKLNRLREYCDEEQKLVHLILDGFTIPVDLEELDPEEIPVVASGAVLLDAMGVESAVWSASVVAASAHARAIEERCNELLGNELIKTDGPDDGIRGLLQVVLDIHREYYKSIANAAKALEAAARPNPDPISLLNDAIRSLIGAQDHLGDDVYASELPAYRAALTAWRDRLAPTPAAPMVSLSSVTIRYIYPFALPGVDGKTAKGIAHDWGRSRPARTFCGLSPLRPADEVPLTDMWTWGGRVEALNDAMRLRMPSLTVGLPGDEDATSKYDVELRFNDVGNHYLRVELTLEAPTLNEINQALRRATTHTGQQEVTSGGKTEPWATIAGYAEEIITDVADWIVNEPREIMNEPVEPVGWWRRRLRNPQGAKKTALESKCSFTPDFDYHVLVVISGAWVEQDGSRREAKKEQVENAYGTLLLQPLNRESTTLDEWICFENAPAVVLNLLGNTCFPSDFAIGTESTTVLYMPTTPSWAESGYIEVAELAASFPPLLRQWRINFEEILRRADEVFSQKDDDHDIGNREAELARLRSELHNALDEIRGYRLYLVPSQLLSLGAERTFLDNLFKQSELEQLRQDVDGYIETGDMAIQRINGRETRLHDHRTRKSQQVLQITLFVLSIFSFSGVLGLYFTVRFGSSVPGWDVNADTEMHQHNHVTEHIWMGSVAALAFLLIVVIWSSIRMSSGKRLFPGRKAPIPRAEATAE